MPDITRRSAVGWVLTSLAGTAIAQEAGKPRPRPIDAPLDVVVPVPPTAFRADGKSHLVYEVHVTNFSRETCALARLEVASLASYSAEALASMVLRPGPPPKDKLTIGGGLRAVLFVWVTLEPGAAIPANLTHRLAVKVGDNPDEIAVECAPIPVRKEAVAISPPLRGGEWLAANGPANASGHRRALIPVGGGVHIAQRFAIDWVQLREDGQTFTGDRLDNKNYRCYGTDALSVADATVVAVKDGIPENIPGATSRAVPITLETVGGNHVILDLGSGKYGFYAHLQPGKIRVKLGDRVKHGQVLGLVGNSGNSTEPHLHFHVCDRNSPLASEGLPYSLTAFDLQGKGSLGGKGFSVTGAPERRSMEMPLQNQVIRFS